jgi:2-deoxy-D-gluconate 3-dehydrogenase
MGRAIALGLAGAGSAVAVLGRNAEKNAAVLAELRALNVPALALRVDVSDRAQLQPALAEVERHLGPITILVNNAAILIIKGLLEHTPEEWDQVMETDLNASFLLAKYAAQLMVGRRAGKIINIASEYSIFGSANVPSYCVAKGALMQLTKSLAIELAPFNIQVNAILPGWFNTELTQPLKTPTYEALYAEIIARTPAGRFGNPEECAGAAIFLASRASDFVTGSTVTVDGGYMIR